jgi:hypothetical protein
MTRPREGDPREEANQRAEHHEFDKGCTGAHGGLGLGTVHGVRRGWLDSPVGA